MVSCCYNCFICSLYLAMQHSRYCTSHLWLFFWLIYLLWIINSCCYCLFSLVQKCTLTGETFTTSHPLVSISYMMQVEAEQENLLLSWVNWWHMFSWLSCLNLTVASDLWATIRLDCVNSFRVYILVHWFCCEFLILPVHGTSVSSLMFLFCYDLYLS